MNDFIRTAEQMPRPGQRVDWIAPDGTQVNNGQFHGGLIWFLPGNNPMYVYYTPVAWRPALTPNDESKVPSEPRV